MALEFGFEVARVEGLVTPSAYIYSEVVANSSVRLRGGGVWGNRADSYESGCIHYSE